MFETIKLTAAVYFTNAWQMLLGLTLIAVIFFAPGGMVGWLEQARARLAAGGAR
ncbi:hypothetical protein D3C72_2441700 [compost metagenome]